MKKLTALALMLLSSVVTLSTVFAFNVPINFPDVDHDGYYMEALSNMVSRGVISGYENGDFGPNDYVTRAQLVTVLDRYDTDFKNLKAIVCSGGGINRADLQEPYEITYDALCGE